MSGILTRALALSCVACALALPAAAGQTPAPDDLLKKLESLRDEILIHAVLKKLNPSADQLKCLLDCARGARGASEEYKKEMKRLTPLLGEAIRALHKEDELNKGLSDAVMQKAARLDHEAKTALKTFNDKVNVFEKKAEDAFTPEQRAVTEGLRTEGGVRALAGLLMPDKGHADRKPAKPLTAVRRTLEMIRAMTGEQWAKRSQGIVEGMVKGWEEFESNLKDEERDGFREHLSTLLDEVRGMDKKTFEESLPKIARDMRPPDKIEELRSELQDVGKNQYGAVGAIGRFLLNERLVQVLEKKLGLEPGPGAAPASGKAGDGGKTGESKEK